MATKSLGLFKLIAISLILITLDFNQNNSIGVESQFSRINSHMEALYEDLRAGKEKKACTEALKALELIKKNYKDLVLIEPDYNWKEIQKVLLNVPSQYCK